MYRIRHRIIKPVLITEEGGEKTCMLSFDEYGCVYTQRHTRAKSQKYACHVPAGIKLALSCTVVNVTNEDNDSNEKEETGADDALGQDHTSDYKECEVQHDINLVLYQRVSCFIHILQLVVHTYDKSSHLKSTMTKAQKVVHKISKSVKATEMLIKMSRKKLANACPTRWSSTFLMISWLLSLLWFLFVKN